MGEADDDPAVLDVLVDGVIVGSVVADAFRDDLRVAGIRDGYAHFAFPLSLHIFDGAEHTVSVRHRGATELLRGSPVIFRAAPTQLPDLVDRIDWANRELLIQTDAEPDALSAAILARRRVAILCTYHTLPSFLGYHELLVTSLERAGYVVLVVHASGGTAHATTRLGGQGSFFYVKRNIGYDFGSWAFGFYQLQAHLSLIDELVLVNDSNVVLPNDLGDTLERLRALGGDIAGLTDSYERSNYHVQSYLIRFSANVCQSAALPIFMSQYPFVSDKETVIEKGELALTKFMLDSGFSVKVMYPYEDVASRWLDGVPTLRRRMREFVSEAESARGAVATPLYTQAAQALEHAEYSIRFGLPLNPTHFFWDTLIEHFGYPFLKRELALLNPAAIPSYFRLSEVLAGQPQHVIDHILEIRRRYGGKLIPFIGRA